MTELESAMEEAAWEHHNKVWEFDEDSCHRVDFKIGFRAALKPEHMKLTEEVKGLIGYCKAKDELLMFYRVGKRPSEKLFKKLDKYREALKPFESEGENVYNDSSILESVLPQDSFDSFEQGFKKCFELMSERHKKTELQLKDCKDFHTTSIKHRNALLEEIAILKQSIIDPQGDFKNDKEKK